jgi:hypothetical protein
MTQEVAQPKSGWSAWSPLKKALAIVSGLLAVAIVVVSFMGGYLIGRAGAQTKLERFEFNKRQLTENLDKPIRERPLLQQIPDRIRKGFMEHGLIGNVIEIEDQVLLIDTPDGARSIEISSETKIVRGPKREAARFDEIEVGTSILVLSGDRDSQKPMPIDDTVRAALIVIDPPVDTI